MIASSRRSITHRERGSTLVEFSLSALLLLMLVLGVVEICRLLLVYNDVANAAAEGVRYAVVHAESLTNPTNVQSVVQNYLGSAPLTPSSATVNACYENSSTTCTGSCASRTTGANAANAPIGTYVTVCVTYPYTPMFNYFPLSVSLTTQSQGVILY